jgi:hypothetical protein
MPQLLLRCLCGGQHSSLSAPAAAAAPAAAPAAAAAAAATNLAVVLCVQALRCIPRPCCRPSTPT